MSATTATKCRMCGEDCQGEFYSKTFKRIICRDCADCLRSAGEQVKLYGKRAGIEKITTEPEKEK